MLDKNHSLNTKIDTQIFSVDGVNTAFDGIETVLQKVIDTIPQTVFWKDKDLIYRGCNRLFAELAGCSSPSHLIGLTDYDLPWDIEEAEFYRACDRKVMESGVPELGIICLLYTSPSPRD